MTAAKIMEPQFGQAELARPRLEAARNCPAVPKLRKIGSMLVGPRQEIEEATSLDIRPIIAWEVERMQGDVSTHFFPSPICADGMTSSGGRNDNYVLRSPDGKYWCRDEGSLEDEAAAVRYLKDLAKIERNAA